MCTSQSSSSIGNITMAFSGETSQEMVVGPGVHQHSTRPILTTAVDWLQTHLKIIVFTAQFYRKPSNQPVTNIIGGVTDESWYSITTSCSATTTTPTNLKHGQL